MKKQECSWCTPDTDILEISVEDKTCFTRITNHDHKYYLELSPEFGYDDEHDEEQISYCPFCGRKL
jgi:hypothetical protein